jgi:hypothetical protein
MFTKHMAFSKGTGQKQLCKAINMHEIYVVVFNIKLLLVKFYHFLQTDICCKYSHYFSLFISKIEH